MNDMFRINALMVEGLSHLRDSYRAYVNEIEKKEKPSYNQSAYSQYYSSFLPYWENPDLSAAEKLALLESIANFYNQACDECMRFVTEHGNNASILHMIWFGEVVVELVEKERTALAAQEKTKEE